MEEQRTDASTEGRRTSSIWDELVNDPIMESTEAITIRRGFFRTWFGVFFDHLGTLVLINLAVTAQLFVGAGLGLALASLFRVPNALGLALIVLVAAAFAAPAWAGLFSYVRLAADPDSLSGIRDYLRAMRRYATRSWILLTVQLGTGLLLAINLRFYLNNFHNLISQVIGVLMLALTLIWAMAGCYLWPLLVRDQPWPQLFRNAFFLALAAPFSTVAMLAGLSALSALFIFTRVFWTLALFILWAITENVALGRLVRIFNERHAPPEDAPAG